LTDGADTPHFLLPLELFCCIILLAIRFFHTAAASLHNFTRSVAIYGASFDISAYAYFLRSNDILLILKPFFFQDLCVKAVGS